MTSLRPIKAYFVLVFLMALLATKTFAFGDQVDSAALDQVDKSLKMLSTWQKEYLNKQKSYEKQAARVLFRNSTEARKYSALAKEAKENVDSLQDEINVLNARKKVILENNRS